MIGEMLVMQNEGGREYLFVIVSWVIFWYGVSLQRCSRHFIQMLSSLGGMFQHF